MTRSLRAIAVVLAVAGAVIGLAGGRMVEDVQRTAAEAGVSLVAGCSSQVVLQRGVDYTVVAESAGAVVAPLGGCPGVPAGQRVTQSVDVQVATADGSAVTTVVSALGEDPLGRRLVSRFVVPADGTYVVTVTSADGIVGHAVAVVYADGGTDAVLRRSIATTSGIVVASLGLLAWVWAMRRERAAATAHVWGAPDPRQRRG
jgi:hypothetical protein